MAVTSTPTLGETNKIYNAKSITLPNAMQVVVVENQRTPAVTHMVWYRVGGADENLGHSGLAHYLEHLMFKGTDLIESGEFSKKVKSWGGNDNAFTSWDFTSYFQTVPKDKLKSVMIMEADRMKNLIFDDQDALTERDVVIQERRQRTDSNPSAQLSEAMRAALFTNHPYGRPIIGWDHELQNLSPQSAREFYKQYYAPQNAILVVSGDVDARNVFELAAQTYGEIANEGAKIRPDWPTIPFMYGGMSITHTHSSVEHPQWRKLYRVPSMGRDYKTALALSVVDEILGGSTGKIYQRLVVDGLLASSAGLNYNGINVADGILTIGATPLENVDADKIAAAVNDLLADIAKNGVSEAEVAQAVATLQDESVYERDSLTGPAMMIGYQLAVGLPLDKIENWTDSLEQVSAEDVQNVVKEFLLEDSEKYHAVTGYLVPKDS